MGLFKLRPVRQEIPTNTRIMVDLDRLAIEPVGFRWKGQVHLIKPMTTERFLIACNEWASLTALSTQSKTNQEAIAEGFAKLISSVCDTITRSDVYEMTLSQRGALLQQVFEIITGKAFTEKKSPMNQETKAVT